MNRLTSCNGIPGESYMSVSETVPPADFVAVTNIVEIGSGVDTTWQRIGSFADAGKYLGVVSELVSGRGDIGSVRKIGDGIREVKVGSGIFSYAYMQSVGPMAAVGYHGNVSLEPTGETSCRLVYTITYDQAQMSGEMRRQTSERIGARFKGMAEAMKLEAEAV